MSDDTADDQDSLALKLIELLNDDQVIAKLQKSLFPKELTTTIDNLSDRIRRLNEKLDVKDEHIKSLETTTLNNTHDERTSVCAVSRRRTTARIPTRKSSLYSTRNSAWSHPCGPSTWRGATAWVERRTTVMYLTGLDPSSSGLAVSESVTTFIGPALG